ncbi:MAG: UDPglucose 6-dehydrogenase [Crocinitomicaceae bacterium]|jgi:UDPglucose 6-dehydrogenase
MNKIGIIGAGRLGLCLALNLERVGYDVIAIDISEERVNQINSKSLVVEEPLVEEYLNAVTNLIASTKTSDLIDNEVYLIFVCVPTPSLDNGKYNHSYILDSVAKLLQFDIPERRVELVINATTMPGFCDELQELLKDTNYFVSYNPEFIAQGSIIKDQQFPDQVLIGESEPESGDRIVEVYSKLCENPLINRMSRTSAEIAKLSVNCFLTTKIAFANSVGDLSIKMKAEHEKILASIGSDSRIGNSYLGYGFGFGGPCLPRDNRALAITGEEQGVSLHISTATNNANFTHLDFQFDQYMKMEEPIIFEQVTYKPGTDIIEESQYLALAVRLMRAGKKVQVRGSEVVLKQVRKLYGDKFIYDLDHDE